MKENVINLDPDTKKVLNIAKDVVTGSSISVQEASRFAQILRQNHTEARKAWLASVEGLDGLENIKTNNTEVASNAEQRDSQQKSTKKTRGRIHIIK
jgi:hypothetical protein